MTNTQHLPTIKHQQGVVLVISLIFLLLISLIAVATSRTSNMELKMSSNEQFRIDGFQRTQAVIEAIDSDDNNFLVTNAGYVVCSSGHGDADCDSASSIALPTGLTGVLGSASTDYQTAFEYEAGVPRLKDTLNKSYGSSYRAAFFSINVDFDDSANKGAKTALSQGSMSIFSDLSQGGKPPRGTSADVVTQQTATN